MNNATLGDFMPLGNELPLESGNEEELSDYRVLLACMRKRLEGYGMADALERLEELDNALLVAIVEGQPLERPPTIN
jgi:hypothetical protein